MQACAGEGSGGVLTVGGKEYLVTLGEHAREDSSSGTTFIYDFAEDVRIRCIHTQCILRRYIPNALPASVSASYYYLSPA